MVRAPWCISDASENPTRIDHVIEILSGYEEDAESEDQSEKLSKIKDNKALEALASYHYVNNSRMSQMRRLLPFWIDISARLRFGG